MASEVKITIRAENLTNEQFAQVKAAIDGVGTATVSAGEKAKSAGGTLEKSFSDPKDAIEALKGAIEHPTTAMATLAEHAAGKLAPALGVAVGAFVALGAIEAVVVEKLWSAVEAAAASGAQIHDLSMKTGESTERLSQLRVVATVIGTSVENLGNTMFMLSRRVGEGSIEMQDGLRKLGLSWLSFVNLSPSEQLLTLSDAFRALPPEANRAQVSFEVLGRAGREALPTLMEPLREMTEQAKAMGIAMSADAARGAQDFEEAQRLVNLEISRFTTVFGSQLLPLFTPFLQALGQSKLMIAGIPAVATLAADAVQRIFQIHSSIAILVVLAEKLGLVGGATRDTSSAVERMNQSGLAPMASHLKAVDPELKAWNERQQAAAIHADLFRGALVQLPPAIRAEVQAAIESGKSTDDIVRALKAARVAGDEVTDVVGQMASAYKKNQTDAKKMADEHAKVVEKLAAIEAGAHPATDAVWKFGRVMDEAGDAAKYLKVLDQIDKIEQNGSRAWIDLTDKVHLFGQQLDEVASADNFRTLTVSAQDYHDKLALLMADGTDRVVLQLEQQRKKEIEALGQRTAVNAAYWDKAKAALDAYYAKAEKEAKRADVSLQSLGQSLANLATVADGSLSGVARGLASVVTMADGADKSIGSIKSGFKGFSDSPLKSLGSLAQGFMGIATIAIQAFSIIKGLLDHTQKDIEHMADAMGVSLSKNLLKTIADTAKQIGSEEAAMMLHLGDIINEVGGVTTANQEKWIGKTRDLFVGIERHLLSVDQASQQLQTVFPQLAKVIVDSNALASRSFLELIALDDRFGTNAAAVNDFVKGQVTNAATGLTALFAGMETSATASAQATFIAMQMAAGATKDDATKAAEAIRGVFVTTETQATGLAAAIVGTFGEMVARGTSFKDALAAIQGPLDTLGANLAATGLSGGAAFDFLTTMSGIAKDAITGPLVDAVGGANQALIGLHNSGILNQDMFAGLATTATDAYNKIIAQGKDGDAALQMMRPTLQTIWELQQEFGYTVDDGTQALLDQAEAAGLVGEKNKSASDKQLDALTKIADKMGVLVDYFARAFPSAVADGFDAAGRKAGELGGIIDDKIGRTRTVKVEYEDPGYEGGGGGGGAAAYPQAVGGDYWVTRPTLFLAGEAGPERATFTPAGRSGGAGGSGVNVEDVAARVADLQAAILQMPNQLIRGWRDAQLLSARPF